MNNGQMGFIIKEKIYRFMDFMERVTDRFMKRKYIYDTRRKITNLRIQATKRRPEERELIISTCDFIEKQLVKMEAGIK